MKQDKISALEKLMIRKLKASKKLRWMSLSQK